LGSYLEPTVKCRMADSHDMAPSTHFNEQVLLCLLLSTELNFNAITKDCPIHSQSVFPFMRKKTECYDPMLITVHGMSQRIALNLSFYFLAINGMPFVSRTSDKIGPEGRNFGYILTISYLSRYLTYQRNFMNFIKFKCCFLDWSLKVFISH